MQQLPKDLHYLNEDDEYNFDADKEDEVQHNEEAVESKRNATITCITKNQITLRNSFRG